MTSLFRCAYYCCGESHQNESLSSFLTQEGLTPRLFTDVIHVHINSDKNEGDVFIFSYGCVAFWGTNEAQEIHFLEKIESFLTSKQSFIVDQCFYTYSEKETEIDEETDSILLGAPDILIKLSLSYALTQSVKLQSFEHIVDKTIESTRQIPQELSKSGKSSLSGRRLSQKMGELFAIQNSINLHSDILDQPEFFWRRPRYEPYYEMASTYMDMKTRLDILNKRVSVIHELYHVLSDELRHSHSSRLEWIVIGLIFVEIFLHIIELLWH